MKEKLDFNRPYNRVEIDKGFEKVKAEMHKEALERGREKYNDSKALYKDGYTGEEIRGGDDYEYDHARSAEEIFNKYKATHTDRQIAEIVNHRSNIIVTKTTINRFKGKYKFESKLKNIIRAKELGIDFSLVRKALRTADLNMSIRACKLAGGFSNSISATFKRLLLILYKFWKFISSAFIVIILILVFLKFYNLDDSATSYYGTEKQTELPRIKNPIPREIVLKPKLSFAKPLDDLTKSVTNISRFDSIVEKQNTIPVIGSMFEFNSTLISKNGKAILGGFVREYNKLEFPGKILIEGFTCTIGSKQSNELLSKVRAKNIEAELIKLGISENSIIIKPIGMQKFVSTTNGENDLVSNRRSNITIISDN